MTEFSADAILADLKGFQQDAVEHVIDRFYRDDDTGDRFLIADETGLGKSVIARGVIARTIEQLQHEASVDRIDIVYICSNADLASQNLRRLNVTGNQVVGMTGRLTMLARDGQRLADAPVVGGKKVNLVSFTPGTSFDVKSWRVGSAPERAMLHLMLEAIAPGDAADERASRLILQGGVHSEDAFQRRIEQLRGQMPNGLDEVIVTKFDAEMRLDDTLDAFLRSRAEVRGLDGVPAHWKQHDTHELIARLRSALAKASLDALEPDLIILDEFQRFRHLLDVEAGGEAAQLADALFSYRTNSGLAAKVLLLSATPYKPYTAAGSDGDEHHAEDFFKTVEFLAGRDINKVRAVRSAFGTYREALTTGQDASGEARIVQDALRPYMSRSERPPLGANHDLHVRSLAATVPTQDDLAEFAALQRLADEIDAPIPIEYWKSIPYFANFMDGYKPAQRVRAEFSASNANAAGVTAALGATRSLDAAALERYEPLDLGNAQLRALGAETLDTGWWKLLWVPPSLPYLEPGPVFSSVGAITKKVIFSSWASVPTAVASLISYEAERRMVGDASFGHETEERNTASARTSVSARFDYVMRSAGPASMSTLALFWPHPALARLGDPHAVVRDGARTAERAEERAAGLLRGTPGSEPAANAWSAFFATAQSAPERLRVADLAAALQPKLVAGDGQVGESGVAMVPHVELALATRSTEATWHPDLPSLALHAPGNIAWRALGRIRRPGDAVTEAGHWRAAALLANALRSLFNRMETMFLLDQLIDADQPYWKSVLQYCADGNLQSVLDEYVFQLRSEAAGAAVTDELLALIAGRAADALMLRPSRYVAHDTTPELNQIPFSVRFAVRYGGRVEGEESNRQPEVRNAFNSPFAPFVLASTSVGQEGIDFHWWSHSVVHWNLPSNPVDFEQREGRVNRFAGHAVRKNIAAAHGATVLSGGALDDDFVASDDIWSKMFELAQREQSDLGQFAPWWVYPGDARIERVLAQYPLSRDIARYERLRGELALYRLTLGQPRQEDMMEMLLKRGIDSTDAVALDLRPPRRRDDDRGVNDIGK